MKKLIIALIAFLLVVGASIFEIVYTTKSYDTLSELSAKVTASGSECVTYKKANELSIGLNGAEDEDAKRSLSLVAAATKERIEALETRWKKYRFFTLSLGNHTVVKSIEERIATLKRQWHTEQWEDLTVTSDALTAYFGGLRDDTHPSLPNLL